MKTDNEKWEISQEHKVFAKNTFFSYLTSYGTILFQIIISVILARLISKVDWGYLILATSYITIIVLISNYFPPALDYTLNYYLSRFLILDQKSKIKLFIKKAIYLKLRFLILTFIISIIIIILLSEIFFVNLEDNLMILYILSPLILIMGLNQIVNGINRSFNMYNIIFFMSLIQFCSQIGGLLLYYMINRQIEIENIAIIQLFSFLFPFIINSLIITFKLSRFHYFKEKEETFETFNKKVFKYGFPISFGYLIYGFWDQIQLQGIGSYGSPDNVTGYNIGMTYANNSRLGLASLSNPLITIFSRLDSKNNLKDCILIYNLIIKYSLFLLLLITGILFFLAEFVLIIIYGESYLIFSNYLKLMLISTIFRVVFTPFEALILAKNKGKILAPIKVLTFFIYVSLFYITLVFFGILGAILSIVMSTFLISLLYNIWSKIYLNIKIDIKQLIKQYITFFISIGLSLSLGEILLNDIWVKILQNSNLIIFEYLPLFPLILFLILFILFNIFLNVFSKGDIENLENLFKKDTKYNRIIRRNLRFFKKFLIFSK